MKKTTIIKGRAWVIRDAAGHAYEGEAALQQLHPSANAPIFGYSEAQLGLGIVGGPLLPLRQTGRVGAEAAGLLLAGRDPETVQGVVLPMLSPAYDWRELKRWGISDRLLPEGSRVDFRQRSRWAHYGWIIAGATGVCLLQAALIAVLFVHRRFRRIAEVATRESADRLSLAAELSGTGLWSLDLRTSHFWLTDRTRSLFGLSPGESLDLDRFLKLVYAADREPVRLAIAQAVESGASRRVEYRVTLPDGGVRWIVSQGRTHPPPPAQPTRLTGVSRDITEVKQGEIRLLQEKQFSDAVINALPGIFYLYNSEGRLVRWNRNHETETGFSAEELKGRAGLDWFCGPYKELIASEMRKVFEEGKASVEAPLLMKDGRQVPYLLGGVRFKMDDQLYFLGVGTDISTLKDAEKALRESEALLQAQVSSSPDIILVIDRDRRILSINKVVTGRYKSPQEVVGMDCLAVLPPEFRDEARRKIDVCLQAGETQEMEHSLPGGIWMYARLVRIGDGSGTERVMIISADVTERKRMEQYRNMGRDVLRILGEQEDNRLSMQRIVAAIKACSGVDAVGIRLQDADDFPYFCHTGFSEAFLAKENSLLGRCRDGGICRDAKGAPILECTCGLVLSGKTDPSNPLFTHGGSAWTNDTACLLHLPAEEDPRTHPRNECIHQGYASVALVPIRGKGRIVGLLQLNARREGHFTAAAVEFLEGVAENIGEAVLRRQAEAEISRGRTAMAHMSRVSILSDLTTSLAHELNQPLAAILSNAQAGLRFLKSDGPDLKEVAEILADIAAEDRRAGEIIHRMRAFLRNDPARREWLDINAVVADVLSILHSETVIHGVSIATDLATNVPRILADRIQLQQVLINLVLNAEHAMSEAGSSPPRVLIRTFKDAEGRVGITIQDNGPGIPEKSLEEVFTPFYSKTPGGLGMGLAISRSIVQANQGRIWAENAPQRGARLCMLFETE